MPQTVRGACPHDCADTCAMIVTVEDDRVVQVAGDPAHPVTAGTLCAKVNDYPERVYAPDRLLYPLVRTGPKGQVAFREASWDEAIGLVARRLSEIRDSYGGEAILPYSYAGTMGLLQFDLMSARLMNKLGASALERTICVHAGLAGIVETMGVSPEVDPERWPASRYLLVWAWNPVSTAPHLWRFLLEARRNGARLVVVDPYRSRTARLADEHIRPIPATDGALALGMMRAMIDEEVHDRSWCEAHTTGYEDFLERLAQWPVERAADVCGIDPDTIRRLGVDFASTQPSLLRLGIGGQRHSGAPMAYRAIACIPALAGSWRHEGGGLCYMPSAVMQAVDWYPLQREDLRPGPVRSVNMSTLGEALGDPDLDPPIKALVCWNANPVIAAPDSASVTRGLRREDLFSVVIEHFMTDTARYADVVLPATMQPEHLDVVPSWGHHYLTLNTPAVTPPGAAKANTEIFRSIAAGLGFDEPHFQETDEELLSSVLDRSPHDVTLRNLRKHGWVKIDHGRGPTPHAEGGFATHDGKIQLRADRLSELGMDPLPTYEPSFENASDTLPARYPFVLLTPKAHFFLNSTFANQRRQQRGEREPSVAIHPDDAEPAGVADGAIVRVHNDRGSFVVRARVTEDVRQGVLVATPGWWNRDYLRRNGPQATTSQRLTQLGAAPTFNDNRVAIEPV